ncbi:MAG: hypothetical protein KBA33_01465 [Cloacibacterium sp.]|nr:hypothetical protein [Cloacibacterium sp.]
MKTYFSLALLLLLLFISCNRIGIPENKKVYYKFTAEDYKYIPDKYANMKGSIITYKSSSNEEIQLKVEGYGLSENNYLKGQYFGTDYYNDGIGMTLKFLNASNDCAKIIVDISKYENNVIGYNFNASGDNKFFSGGCGGFIYYLNLPQDLGTLQKMTVNNITYAYVYTINCIDISSFGDIYLNPNFQFDKIYFDLKQGVIGVKNANNQETYWIQP